MKLINKEIEYFSKGIILKNLQTKHSDKHDAIAAAVNSDQS